MALVAETSHARTAEVPDISRPAAPTWRRFRWRLWLVVFVAAAALLVVVAVSRLAAPPTAHVIVASGRIEGRSVTLAPKNIQARVKRLLADEGDRVRKDQRLAELEVAQIEARHTTLSAQVASLDAQIQEALLDVSYTAKNSAASIAVANADVSSAQAQVLRAQAIAANARIEHERAAGLYAAGAISQQEFDQRELGWRVSIAELDAAEKGLARAQASLAFARASTDTVALKQQRVRALQETRRAAVGQVEETEANLAERYVVAPTDGTILSRPVEVGDVVNAGSPVFEMVDMSRLYLKVYIPEAEIGKLRLGNNADVTVDAFPGTRFAAHVSRIHDEAEFTPKNVETAEERLKLVFGVELSLSNTDGLLKPGMPADCEIHWNNAGATGAGHDSR